MTSHDERRALHPATIAIHTTTPDPATGAVTPPIHLSTTFEREADGGYRGGYIYSRYGNPNRTALEGAVAALEGGTDAAAFASGSAATMAVLHSLAPGDHVLLPDDAYFGTTKLARELFGRWGLEVTPVDMIDLDAVRRAVRDRTRLVWVETPSNPLVRVADVAALARIARDAGARCVVDNTWASPLFQQPLALGADLVMHSTTKYLGGHSDVLGGALVTRDQDDFWERVRLAQSAGGAVPSPFDCWLLLRGMRTLGARMRVHAENALELARWLDADARVEEVHYPGLPTHAGHALAARQMRGFGGMLAVQVGEDAAAAMAFTKRLRLFTTATSLGGTESLIEHRASIEGEATRAPQNLLRISVGLEDVEDLRADLDQALDGPSR